MTRLFDSNQRDGGLDYLRFVMAACIIYFHAGLNGATYALSALPAFVLLSIYFGAGRPLADRFRRLIVPWLFWSAVFFALKICDATVSKAPVSSEFEPYMALTGPALHLWYLPFIFAATILVTAASRLSRRQIEVFGGTLAFLFYGFSVATALPTPFEQWFSVMPAVCMAAMLIASDAPKRLLFGGAIAFGAIFLTTGEDLAVQQTIALASIFVVSAVHLPAGRLSGELGAVSLGVYLVHPIPLGLFERMGFEINLWVFAATVVVSTLVTAVLRRVAPAVV
ncbi:MAG: hypothetical protein HRU32_03190 [Rhodobacteraceae bacterium]|nr:hypothetical protein [Paracoccaceae bacterium]